MAAGGVSLAACAPGGAPAEEDAAEGIDVFVYGTVPECRSKGEVPDSACERAALVAVDDDAKTARWGDRNGCEALYGWGQCVVHVAADGRTTWGPRVVGFAVGRAGGGDWSGRGLYRDGRDGGFYTAGGGRMWTDYATGRRRVAARSFGDHTTVGAPARVLTRTPVVSRRGFGKRLIAEGWGG